MNNTRVQAAWFTDVAAAPPDTGAPSHPSRTRAWAAAWQQMRTEQVLAHHHLHLHDTQAGIRETVSFYLVPGHGSPYWSRLETAAGIPPVWPGPVLYAGSPHAEYGGAGTSTTHIAQATAAGGLRLAEQTGAHAVVYPGLTPAQAKRLTAAAGPAQPMDLGIDVAFTRPLGADLEQWWSGIPQKYRGDTRRTWRRGNDAGLTLTALPGTSMRPQLPRFATLANTTASKHSPTRLYGTDTLHRLIDVPGAVLLAAKANGTLVAGFYGWLHRQSLYLWAAGIDYSHPAARRVYKWLLTESAQWAIDHGATTLDLGRSNYAAKIKLGCHPQPLRTVVHLPQPAHATATALTDLSRRLGDKALRHLPARTPW